MIRRLAIAVLPLLALTACGDGGGSAQPTGLWFTAPQDDDQRLEVLHRARGIDPCALLSRAELGKLGAVRSVVNDQPDSCKAETGPAESYKGIDVSWAVVVATVQKGAKSIDKTIDGTRVSLAGDRENLSAEQFGQLVERSCTATAQFPSGAALMMFIDTPLGTEPCDLGEKLLHTAIAEWVKEPPRGTSPDSVLTVLTAADPCDVLPRLGVTVNPADRRLRTCDFTYRGDAISIAYGYEKQNSILGSRPGDQPADPIDGHVIYRDTDGTNDFHFYTAVVGQAINPSAPDPTLGPSVPTVSVTGKNDEVLTDVMRQILPLLPSR